ncbi:hypothetical protein KUA24_162 [Vibrio phage HNL01]|nr:hypothetical protein KUA24_162 [Vibrio phage HNL01]
MTYKEFLKYRLKEAKQDEWFDEGGNNPLAVSTSGFIKTLKNEVNYFNSGIKSSLDLKELLYQLFTVFLILLLPLTYLPILLIRIYFRKSRSHKEMQASYEKFKKENP